jgi:RND family efflux transporter MFP subunit
VCISEKRYVIAQHIVPAATHGAAPDVARPAAVPAVIARPAQPQPAVQSPKPRTWLWALAALGLLGLGGLLLFKPWASAVVTVSTETLSLGPVARVLAVNGRIAAQTSVDIRAQVSGTLVDLPIAEGDFAGAGAVLARIDAAAPNAVVRAALAGLDAALVAQANAQAVYARTKALGTNAARVVLESAARGVETAAQEALRMTALLDQAQLQLDKYTIRAPQAGTVLTLKIQQGQTADPSAVLMTLADMGKVLVETDVDESYATQIKLGQAATLQLAGEANIRQGRVSFVSQRVDEATGGLAIKLMPLAPIAAPIGLTVTANITVDDRAAALTVPRAAIVRERQSSAVFVVTNQSARRQVVSVIEWPATRLIVTDGLKAGDVVISDAAGIADGQSVSVAPQ